MSKLLMEERPECSYLLEAPEGGGDQGSQVQPEARSSPPRLLSSLRERYGSETCCFPVLSSSTPNYYDDLITFCLNNI